MQRGLLNTLWQRYFRSAILALAASLLSNGATIVPAYAQGLAPGLTPGTAPGARWPLGTLDWTRGWAEWRGQNEAPAQRFQFVAVDGQPFNRALQVQSAAGETNVHWALQRELGAVPGATGTASEVTLRVWLRAREATLAPLHFRLNGQEFSRRTTDGVRLPTDCLALTPEWKQWTLFWRGTRGAGELTLDWKAQGNRGQKAQSMEIGPLELTAAPAPAMRKPQFNVSLPDLKAAPGNGGAEGGAPWNDFGNAIITTSATGQLHLAVPFNGAQHGVCLWNLKNGVLERTVETNFQVLGISPDGSQIAGWFGDHQGGTIGLGNLSGGWREIRAARAGEVLAVNFCPAAGMIALTLQSRVVFYSQNSLTLEAQLLRPPGPVLFSPDGRTHLIIDPLKQQLQVTETATGRKLKTIENFHAVADEWRLSHDGSLLAGRDGLAIVLWDLVNGKALGTLHDECQQFVLAPNGKHLALSGGPCSDVRIYATNDLQLRATLPGKNPARTGLEEGRDVPSLQFTTDERLISSFRDGLVQSWNWAAPRLLSTMLFLPPTTPEGAPEYVSVTPEGYYNCSPGTDRLISFMQDGVAYGAERFHDRYYKPELVAKCLRGEAVPPDNWRGPKPPLLWVNTPARGARFSGDKLTVLLHVEDDSAVGDLKFLVNGKPVQARNVGKPVSEPRPRWVSAPTMDDPIRGMVAVGGRALDATGEVPQAMERKPIPAIGGRPIVGQTLTYEVPVAPGETANLQVLAYDDDGLQSAAQSLTLEPTNVGEAFTTGRLLGRCIGISTYQDSTLNLKFAHKDAMELARALLNQRGYTSASAEYLTDTDATRDGILAKLDDLVQETKKNDTVILLLAGHGWRDDNGEFYFASSDLDRRNIAGTALPWRSVMDRLRALAGKSKRVIVLLDACHSGSALPNAELVRALEHSRTGVLVFAGSDGENASLEREDWEHGAFTKAILEAIKGIAVPQGLKDVSVLEFMAYVGRRVAYITENKQKPMVPNFTGFVDGPLFFLPEQAGTTPNAGPTPTKEPNKLLSGQTLLPPRRPRPPKDTIPRSGNEWELNGKVGDIDFTNSIITMVVTQMSRGANSAMVTLPQPEACFIRITDATSILRWVKDRPTMDLEEMHQDDVITVFGINLRNTAAVSGPVRTFEARAIRVYEEATPAKGNKAP